MEVEELSVVESEGEGLREMKMKRELVIIYFIPPTYVRSMLR